MDEITFFIVDKRIPTGQYPIRPSSKRSPSVLARSGVTCPCPEIELNSLGRHCLSYATLYVHRDLSRSISGGQYGITTRSCTGTHFILSIILDGTRTMRPTPESLIYLGVTYSLWYANCPKNKDEHDFFVGRETVENRTSFACDFIPVPRNFHAHSATFDLSSVDI